MEEIKMTEQRDKSIKQMGVDGDVLDGFINLDPNKVFVPEGRFRGIKEGTVKSIMESIEKHGQMQPIIVDSNGNLIAGNHRLNACMNLGIYVEAKVTTEIDPDKLALVEIDENLIRAELTPSQLENHLAKRKEIYNKLYPETAKRGKKAKEALDKKSFTDDTAEITGMSASKVDRMVRRGQEASEELQEARDNKEITSGDMDSIIKETGADKEAQKEKMKELIKSKAEKKNQKEKEELPEESTPLIDEELKAELVELEKKYEQKCLKLKQANATIKALQDRIGKAKSANPQLKI